MAREDTFRDARKHLEGVSDADLKERFWNLTRECIDPIVELAATHTSPSIERSVLMRMGIDSVRCQAIVAECEKRGLLGHGAGHVVWVCMRQWSCDAPTAAERLADGEGWETVETEWGEVR